MTAPQLNQQRSQEDMSSSPLLRLGESSSGQEVSWGGESNSQDHCSWWEHDQCTHSRM